ncbi:hypothetical protein MHU86_23643 [Fragilaria crotonensis]|nr:hypothetical protein MHU86_23643 [Fragilaria crotonensis]
MLHDIRPPTKRGTGTRCPFRHTAQLVMTMTDPETRFLQNQQARKAAVRKHTKTNDANSFWAYLRGELALWNTRVERHNHEYLIAAERQLALQELETLQQDLKAMQKAALIQLGTTSFRFAPPT